MEIDYICTTGLPPDNIKDYGKSFGGYHDQPNIIGKLGSIICSKRKKHWLMVALTLVGLILISVIIGISLKISNGITPNSMFDVPENTTAGKIIIPLIPKKPMQKSKLQQPYETSTNHQENDAAINVSSLHFETVKTTAGTSSGLITNTAYKSRNQLLTEDTFKASDDEHVETPICEEFELVSSDVILQHMPELIGLYRLENVTSNENKINQTTLARSTLVYSNKANGIILVQSDQFSLKSGTYLRYKKPFRNLWVMKDSISNRLLAFNSFCNDPDFPINGACQYGWNAVSLNEKFRVVSWKMDLTASVTCNMPDKSIRILPSESICKEFEVKPMNTFSDSVLRPFLGHYELTDSNDRQRVEYNRINSTISLFSHYDNGKLLWIIGNRNLGSTLSYIDYDMQGVLTNYFCFDKEYPANGECANNWFYTAISPLHNHTITHIHASLITHIDIRATIQCTMY